MEVSPVNLHKEETEENKAIVQQDSETAAETVTTASDEKHAVEAGDEVNQEPAVDNDGNDKDNQSDDKQNQDEAAIDPAPQADTTDDTEKDSETKTEPEEVKEPVESKEPEQVAATDEPDVKKSTNEIVQELFADATPTADNKLSSPGNLESEDYDPESAFTDNNIEKDSKFNDNSEIQENKDNSDYEPELKEDAERKSPATASISITKPHGPAGLPPKPPVNATVKPSTAAITEESSSQQRLKDAYDAIINSPIGRDPEFLKLPAEEQVDAIKDQLQKLGIDLSSGSHPINFDQVYSYNKPFKNLKDPIPLVPIGQFCRRPNITAPTTPEEEQEYADFIERENYYLNLQNWDEFPDKLRLFIGNLPANTISKQDLFRIFSKYGEVIQIAIKAGYGFAQFRTGEACLECIKGETNIPLHNKILRLDASRPQKSRRPGHPEINNPNMSGRGRERVRDESQDQDEQPSHKKRKGNIDCQVYVTGKSSVFFIRKVKKAFAMSQVTIDVEDVTQRNINEVLSEAAYSGVLAACVIKEQKVDIQTFESTPDGGIKFDEYADVEPEEGAEIVLKAKVKKYGDRLPAYVPQDTSYHDNSRSHPAGPAYNSGPRRGGERNRGSRRGDRHGGRRGGYGAPNNDYGHGRGRGSNHNSWNQQPYGSVPPPPQQQPYGSVPPPPPQSSSSRPPQSYGQPYYGNQQPTYGSPVQQPAMNQWNSPPQPPQNPAANLLQGLNPAQIQSMIQLLQSQQQGGQPPQGNYGQPQRPAPNSYGGMGYNNNNNYGSNAPSMAPQPQGTNDNSANQVQALLAQLQSNQQGNSYGQPSSQNQQGQGSSFYDTLSRLAKQ